MTTAIASDPDLGNILLVQKPSRGSIGNLVFLLSCGFFCLALGLPALFLMPVSRISIVGGLTSIGVGSSLCVFVWIMLKRYRMHVFLQELGICEYRQGRARSLRYDHVDELTYTSLRIFQSGSYIHTVQKLALKSDNTPGPPLVCTLIVKEADGNSPLESRSAVTDVRNMISCVIEERLAHSLGREGRVDWTRDMRIGASGLDVTDRKGVKSRVAWKRISKMEVNQGMFRLWVDASVKPHLRATTAQPNFFPGYALALRLWQQSGI